MRKVIGRGGFSYVYRAFDEQLRREIALKVIRSDRMAPSTLSRARREVSIARDVANPHLLRVYDLGVSDDLAFLSMELAEGGTLADLLSRGSLSIGESVRIAREILSGLAALHAVNVIHRDIKPANILLDPKGAVRLADLGLARHLSDEETRITLGKKVLGTLDYLSPEQARGIEASPSSDLYAVGLVLFEMLTGRRAFHATESIARLTARLESRPPRARSFRKEVPRWLDHFVSRLLEPAPADRYPDAGAALAELARGRVGRTKRQRKRRALLVAGAIALGLLGVGSYAWRLSRPVFSRVSFAKGVVKGISSKGRTLWSLGAPEEDAQSLRHHSVTLQLASPPGPVLAIVGRGLAGERYGTDYRPLKARLLEIVNLDSGKIIRSVELPPPPSNLDDASDRYFPQSVHAVDLGRNPGQQLLVTFVHKPSYPSYSVIWNPALNRARYVFAASGWETYRGEADLDGDGRPELLFAGTNNRLGWYNALAAVRFDPSLEGSLSETYAVSPDLSTFDLHSGSLAWYSLLPPGQIGAPILPAKVFSTERRIEISFPDGRQSVLGFDGLEPSEASSSDRAGEARAYQRAWKHLSAALHLIDLRNWKGTKSEIDSALNEARRSRQPLLVECVRRQEARELILSGDVKGGLSLFTKLLGTASQEARPEIVFDAAQALYLSGHFQDALDWYQQGIGRSAQGKPQFEFMAGEVFSLVALGRYLKARKTALSFATSNNGDDRAIAEAFASFADWRSGKIPTFGRQDFLGLDIIEPLPYWILEFERARGEHAQALLPRVNETLKGATATRGPLLSLKAVLLESLNREEQAQAAAREAMREITAHRYLDSISYAHYGLVKRRCDAILRLDKTPHAKGRQAK